MGAGIRRHDSPARQARALVPVGAGAAAPARRPGAARLRSGRLSADHDRTSQRK